MSGKQPVNPFATGSSSPDAADSRQFKMPYGKGGVPWYLFLYYLGYLALFTWYALEFQLPDYLAQGPGRAPTQVSSHP